MATEREKKSKILKQPTWPKT